MVRLVSVVVPQNHADEVLDHLYNGPTAQLVYQITSFDTLRHTHISFKTRPKHLQEVIGTINTTTGCGAQYGAIDVMSLITTRPTLELQDARKKVGKKRLYKINDRMSVDEIHSIIDDGNHLTFDFMALVATASVIAGAGLLADSSTTVIASMLVSPLMGPILSLTFGLSTNDFKVIKRGMRNEIAGVLISLTTGFIMGLGSALAYPPDYRSSEMTSRGTPLALIYGFIVAAPSGMGVVLAVSMGGVNAIVGTAISASLLPPIVNAGICCAMGLFYYATVDVAEHGSDADDLMGVGLMSFALFIINFAVIVVVGFITFRYIKDIYPPDKDEANHAVVDRESCRISRFSGGSAADAMGLRPPIGSGGGAGGDPDMMDAKQQYHVNFAPACVSNGIPVQPAYGAVSNPMNHAGAGGTGSGAIGGGGGSGGDTSSSSSSSSASHPATVNHGGGGGGGVGVDTRGAGSSVVSDTASEVLSVMLEQAFAEETAHELDHDSHHALDDHTAFREWARKRTLTASGPGLQSSDAIRVDRTRTDDPADSGYENDDGRQQRMASGESSHSSPPDLESSNGSGSSARSHGSSKSPFSRVRSSRNSVISVRSVPRNDAALAAAAAAATKEEQDAVLATSADRV